MRSHIKHFFILMVVGVVGALFASTAAQAVSYSVTGTGGVGLNERSGPGTSYSILRTLPEGAAIDIVCQTTGTSVNGSSIWDKLLDGGYVSDFYTTTPVFNGYSPGIPVCGTVTPPVSREANAVAWAKTQMNSTSYEGWCDRFVANAYGRATSGYVNAAAHLADMQQRGAMHFGDYSPPSGALVFFYAGKKNGYNGHVMLSTGGGQAISSDHWVGKTHLGVGYVSTTDTHFGSYAGWAWANVEWPGR